MPDRTARACRRPRDPWAEPAFKEWARHVLDDMAPKLAHSATTISLVPDGEGDVKFWVELGASIMLDKPIIAVVIGDTPIPAKLNRIADEIIRLPDGFDSGAGPAIAAAVRRVTEKP